MIPKHIDAITADDIRSLLNNTVAEGRTLEYKRDLPGDSDADRKEFLADVASFANAGGGDIVFGVDEERVAGKKTGRPAGPLGLALSSTDEETQRIKVDQIIRSGLQPRLAGVAMRFVPGLDRGPVLVLRIPQSFAGPHMVIFKSESRFFSRNSNGKQPLDVHEIRAAFLASEAVPERMRQFRLERVGRLLAGEGPIPLSSGSKLVLHMLPLGAFDGTRRLDVTADRKKADLYLPPLGSSGYSGQRFNIDGYVTYDQMKGEASRGYTQLFRHGSIESVRCDISTVRSGRPEIPSRSFEELVCEAVRALLTAQQKLEVGFPIYISLSLLHVKDTVMSTGPEYGESGHGFDRDTVLIPELELSAMPQEIPSSLKPLFDMCWQAAGWSRSIYFDANGKWQLSPR